MTNRIAQCTMILWMLGVLSALTLAQTDATKEKIIPLPASLTQNLPAVVAIYNINKEGILQPVSFGFFVNPWTVVTSHQRLQEAGNNGSLRLTIKSLDGKTNYRPLFVDLVDKDKDWVKIEVRERNSQVLAPLEIERLKSAEKVFLLKQVISPNEGAVVLVEAPAPLTKEQVSMPLFNEAGQLIGMAIEPSAKEFSTAGMLSGKALAKLNRDYVPAFKNDKLVCLARMECYSRDKKTDKPATIAETLKEAKIAKATDLANIEIQASTAISAADYPRILKGYVLRKVASEYPPIAKSARVAGSVPIRVVYGETGEVIFAQPLSGHQFLIRAALEAARQWVFEPTILDGQKIKVEGTLIMQFTLQ